MEKNFGLDYGYKNTPRRTNDEFRIERESGPVCSFCGEVITEVHYFDFGDDEIYCRSCVNEQFRKKTSEY